MDTLQAISVGATQAVRIYVSKVTSILSPREAHFSPYDDFILAAPSRLASLIRTGIAKYSNTGVQEWIVQIGSNEDDYLYTMALNSIDCLFVGGYTEGDLAGVNTGSKDICK